MLMDVCVLYAYLVPMKVRRGHRIPLVLGPLELELWIVVGCHMVLGPKAAPLEERQCF